MSQVPTQAPGKVQSNRMISSPPPHLQSSSPNALYDLGDRFMYYISQYQEV